MEDTRKEAKQVIVMRKDLNMRKGKMISQGAHASLAVLLDMMYTHDPKDRSYRSDDGQEYEWVEKCLVIHKDTPLDSWLNKIFKKIVVGTETLSECVKVYEEAKKAGIPCALIEDKGLTEFGGKITITCCAIGPAYPEDIDPITGHLPLL